MGKGPSKAGNAGGGTQFKYEKSILKGGKPTKKSQEIFDSKMSEARNWIKDGADGEHLQLSTLNTTDSPNETISMKAMKGVQTLIDNEKRNLDARDKYGIGNPKRTAKNRLAVNVVQRTLNSFAKDWL